MINRDKASDPINFWTTILLLTIFLLLLEISFFIQCNNAYFSDFTFVSHHIAIPFSVIPGILYFIVAQLLLHLMYALLIWLVSVALIKQADIQPDNNLRVVICVWLLGLVTILTANQYFYPNSKFAELTYLFLPGPIIAKWFFYFLLLACIPLLMLTVFFWTKRYLLLSLLIALMGITAYWTGHRVVPLVSVATETQPNIILVGVDSLRPDFLGFYGHEKPTPFLDGFLNQAASFSEAVTPLARTFPSWTSVLTGEYPHQSGVRFNLASQQGIDLSHTLPAILRQQGYTTIFATDETRFSNIDHNFGFDQIITPPMGLNDFLIGTFNDFPLSNLVINTKVGKWLFPYSYANRPVYFTYDPNQFLTELRSLLFQPRHQPVLMAVHFCLPHYPYLWAQMNGRQYTLLERYEASVQRVDRQVGDFFAMLQQAHMLDHAIVVILSDHGEALELRGDRITERAMFTQQGYVSIPTFYPPSLDDEDINQSAGHGTDVLGLPQYHTLLAFRIYGGKPLPVRSIPGVVSLLDIKPTVLQLIGQPSSHSSGRSQVSVLRGRPQLSTPQHIFLESDYTPQAIRTIYPETRNVMLEGIQLFQIDKISTRLTVKDTMATMIVNSKQYADIYGEWMLAIYPQNSHTTMPILINLASGEWTNDLHSSLAIHSPAQLMMNKLNTFFESDHHK